MHNLNVGETLACERKPIHKHSQNAIAVKNKDQKVIRHVLEALALFNLFTLMHEYKIYKVSTTISGEKRKAPEGTWVPDGSIEIPCKYSLYGLVIHKTFVRDELRR